MMSGSAILDVTIGMLLLFLVVSLVASAIVEAIGGFFHRRSKHLWDTLDLLLGNTASAKGETQSIVAAIYSQPFITGLVRPTDRLRFDPAVGGTSRAPAPPKKLPQRARARKNMNNLPMGAAGTVPESALRRRFYGPISIDAREFTNALLSCLRPAGTIDRARSAIEAISAATSDETAADFAISIIEPALGELRAAAVSLGSGELAAAVARITDVGDSIRADELAAALRDAEAAITSLFSETPTTAEVVKMLDAAPGDLRTKLLAVTRDVGSDFADIRVGVEDWYDRNMAAASTWYRKQTRWFLFLTGLVLAVALNVDAVHAATTLYQDESVREGLVAVADEISAIDCDSASAPAAATPSGTDPPASDDPSSDVTTARSEIDLDCLRGQLGEGVAFPVGWDDVDTSFGGWVLRGLGWLLVATAVTLGAPFWFDLLGRALARKRGKPA
ncbi:MAG TPA: hypothetical protein VFV63_08910 [Ilumatobacteraceae bacterium]|nr:hypothetical protein [Ilumatobacteraceae bacterium]